MDTWAMLLSGAFFVLGWLCRGWLTGRGDR